MKRRLRYCSAIATRFKFHFKPKRLELDMKNRDTPPTKSSVDEPPKQELKVLPSHLRYVFLGQNNTLPVIIVADLSEGQIEALISVLKWFKRAIGWTCGHYWDSPRIYSHKIQPVMGQQAKY
ncbi:hypothetical protein H5410_061138 [Solanum commersonii]|uniref:Uncharacterized protein n=1 Tax=Solanum commersonii TaxID=4109 RepID=A0A9J5W824_SOLCO|nr:hypothetical protein H5410_061138 [Solanum commersonii]